MEERVLTKLMDISATVGLDSQEYTVKVVSTPFKLECSINMTNHTFILHAMELARAKGPPVTQHSWFSVQHHSKYIKIKSKPLNR